MSPFEQQGTPAPDRLLFQFSTDKWTGCGTVRVPSANCSYPFSVRLLTSEDLAELYALHLLILSTLPHPHVLRPDSRDFIERNLRLRGVTFGAYCRRELIAYSVVAFPHPDEESPSVDLPQASIEPNRVAVYDGSAVHPAFRGSHLHAALNQMRREYAVRAGYYHLMGTVSIFNPFSLTNHLEAGFFVKGIKNKYGGMIRLIIHQDTRADPRRNGWEEQVVSLEDCLSHSAATESGMWGFRVHRREGGSVVQYGFFA